MIRVVAFDFDGTIADSFDVFIETFRSIAPKGVDVTIPPNELRGLSVPEVLKMLKIKRISVPGLIIRGRKEMAKNITEVSIFKGLTTELKQLQKQGIVVCILSSNSKESIATFLKNNDLDGLIDEVIGDISLFGKAKAIKKLAKSRDCNNNEVVYIGDEVRDIAAAKKADVISIAVSWGFNTKEALKKHEPSFVADKPAELSKLITKL
jgi:phosphoglycolate phosphatase